MVRLEQQGRVGFGDNSFSTQILSDLVWALQLNSETYSSTGMPRVSPWPRCSLIEIQLKSDVNLAVNSCWLETCRCPIVKAVGLVRWKNVTNLTRECLHVRVSRRTEFEPKHGA